MLLLSCAWPAAAQEQAEPDRLSVTPALRLQYDSNMLRLNEQRLSGRRDDTRITPGISFQLRRQIGLHSLAISGDAGYDFHRRFKFLDRARVNGVANANILLGGRCTAAPRARLEIAQTELSELGVPVGNMQTTQDYQLTLACPRPSGFYPSVTGGLLRASNSADSRRRYDLRTETIRGALGYAKPSLGDIQLSASYQRFARPGLLETTGIDDGTDVYQYGVVFNRAVAPRVKSRIGLSYLSVKPHRKEVEDFSGLGWEGEIAVSPTPRFTTTVGVERSARSQSNFGASYIVQTDYRLSTKMQLSARSALTLAASRSGRRFRGENNMLLPIPRLKDRTTTFSAGYQFTLRDALRIGLNASHEKRSADNDFYAYSATTVTLSAGTRF
ncbi:gellan polysaccharide biosynthesis protein GelF [Sphingomonas oleivorans]|uniref:Gellan polysaccharide biosynthesis protein GelF n=2 Tax=Sphingomonas oleivorans TaxID=1735121 RepID=A0A2T5FYY1_9SPHN|nr:gellan polysaccharide biosynthesis protein GelF [Sphingomonas oleivorans]